MKKYFIIALLSITAISFTACSDGSDSVSESQIDTNAPILNDLDNWLRSNFVSPYNIEVLYKWDINDTDIDRFLHPPLESSVRPVAEALQKAWIEPYTALGGADFIKKIAPRQFTLVGGFNFNPNSPTITLGIAEAGTKITLFNIDFLDFTDINSIKQPLKTVQHEYGHILNQNIPIDVAYGQINPENYNSNWFNRSDAEARELGYITAYASSQEGEDFVEMVSEMLTNSKEDFDAILSTIVSAEARAIIRLKESMVVEYYQTNFGIDIYELQALTDAATQELVN
ncbi:putative zinc-binding metallopeptidase [Flavivirga abyssicola]|uniref:zinc-binding metallopeptidase n=1 Tax=Flavivirga abyssicola TaxID=3063533 RepID=UPI0026DF6C53|nr:putative zinc-binding metallopeptidase [Flavivirga sp. MEBiC07777]WVK14074.1 putative zinc-binding metallopeptidase [Flavivirga sp. MEBiC07777]